MPAGAVEPRRHVHDDDGEGRAAGGIVRLSTVSTEDLISDLAQDLTPRWSLRTLYGAGLVAGVLAAALVFFAALGIRPDVSQAAGTVRFLFKFVVTLSLAAAAVGLLFPLSRPGAAPGAWTWLLAAVPGLLLAGVLAELAGTPAQAWGPRLVGTNALLCLLAIPAMAIGPLGVLIACLRRGAPTRPGLTGAVAGLAASGIAATFYASHCPDDSPLFVATWYGLASAAMALVGSVAGRAFLRW